MKRFTSLAGCLLILLALAVSAWADCARLSAAPTGKQQGSATAGDHEHPSDGHHHDHSHQSAIHCPTLDEFVPTAAFSASRDQRTGRIPLAVAGCLGLCIGASQLHPINWPPGRFSPGSTPRYLSLSVLRI